VRKGAEATRHLFRVAAGLDSLVVGEPQILGQVKNAYATASDQQYTGTLLNRLFHTAFATGKRVRSETGLGEGSLSVSYAAISLARKIFGNMKHLSVVVLGSGEMAKLTALNLRRQGVENMTIASRTRACGWVARPWTSSTARSTASTSGTRRSSSGVGCSPSGPRRTTGAPSLRSSADRRLPMVLWSTPIVRAAPASEPDCTARRK